MRTADELMASGYSIENAEITNVALTMANHECLTLEISLKGRGWSCVYGGHCLGKGYLGAQEFQGSEKGLEAIMQIMNTVGVNDLFDMKGKYVRAAIKDWGSKIKIIGNILDDVWFDDEKFFQETQ